MTFSCFVPNKCGCNVLYLLRSASVSTELWSDPPGLLQTCVWVWVQVFAGSHLCRRSWRTSVCLPYKPPQSFASRIPAYSGFYTESPSRSCSVPLAACGSSHLRVSTWWVHTMGFLKGEEGAFMWRIKGAACLSEPWSIRDWITSCYLEKRFKGTFLRGLKMWKYETHPSP